MLVVARGLGRTYNTARGRVVAVDGIDLDIAPGEFLAICGRSGSGKSTLLGMIGGLCLPSSGSVTIDQTDLYALDAGSIADFRARRLGFMFQFSGLLPNLRAIDNVALPALLGGVRNGEASERALSLLRQVGLSDRWDAHPGELSGGEQRRIAVARALINRPILLLADEPTNDLDEQAEQEVLTLLRRLQKTYGTTLIVVTHNRDLAAEADRMVTLRAGRLVSVTRLTPSSCDGPAPALQAHPLAMACQTDAGATTDGDGPFETAQPALRPTEPTLLGAGFGRFLVGFLGWVAVVAGALFAIDSLTAQFERQAIQKHVVRRKKSEELAMQQLRADVADTVSHPDGNYEVTILLQSFAPDKPFYVLGPELRAFVQIDRTWQPVPIRPAAEEARRVLKVRGERQVVPFTFRIDTQAYDELIPGYYHLRFTSVMVVSATVEPTEDLFERTDDYYIYLKPQELSDDDVRERNQWQPGAIVPRWIPMPAH